MKTHYHRATLTGLLALLVCAPQAKADGILAVDNPANNGLTRSVYADALAFEGNDSVAMRQYTGKWQGDYTPHSGDNLGLLFARAETGAQWNGFRLGALYRAEAIIKASPDTSDLVWQYHNSSGYDTGRTYQVNYRIEGFEANGARLSKSFQSALGNAWQLSWGAGMSLLNGKQIKVETMTGQVVTLSSTDFNADVIQNSTYSGLDTSGAGKFNPPFGMRPSVSGQGYALDLGLTLRRQDGLRLEAAVNDLAASIRWKNLPNYAANYNSATKYFDTSGYVHFNPTATAQSSYQDLTQTLDPKLWLAAAYPVAGFEAQLATSYTQGEWFPEMGLAYAINPQWRINTSYDTRFGTVQIGLHHTWFDLSLRSDKLALNQAKAYGLSASVHIAF
jgi:hypothetical protein